MAGDASSRQLPKGLGLLAGLLVTVTLAHLLTGTSAVDAGQYVQDAFPPPEEMPHEAVDLSAASAKAGGGEDMDLESMLHWAISHSDPEVLKKHAAAIKQQEAIASLKERKARVKELIDVMNQQPTETGLIKEAVSVLTHPEATTEQHLNALTALQILVEPIDNANDLKVLGGIDPVMAALSSPVGSVRAAAAYVVGTAASNNPKFQEQLMELHPKLFTQLVKLITAGEGEVVVKGLYAVAAMVRNLATLRQTFLAAGGLDAVHHVLAGGSPGGGVARMDHRAQRKALALLIDLIHLDADVASTCLKKGLASPISRLLLQPDTDLQEKALDTIKTLVRYSSQAAEAFHEAGAVSGTDKLHTELLEHLMAAAGDLDDHYIKYLLGLVREVQMALKPSAKAGLPRIEL